MTVQKAISDRVDIICNSIKERNKIADILGENGLTEINPINDDRLRVVSIYYDTVYMISLYGRADKIQIDAKTFIKNNS